MQRRARLRHALTRPWPHLPPAEQWAEQQREAAEAGGSQQGGEGEEAAGPPPAAGAPPPPFGLPTSLVKKIMVMDGDVGRVSADGLRAVAKATELFLQLFAAKAYAHAKAAKRKNIKFCDLAAVAGRDRRLVDMGLGDLLERDPVFAEVGRQGGAVVLRAAGGAAWSPRWLKFSRGQVLTITCPAPCCRRQVHARAEEENQGRRGNKRAADDDEEGGERGGKGMRPITAFFAANP